jgi:hypothetical protein
MKLHRFGTLGVLLAVGALAGPAAAQAAPVTVNLRIEGSSSTVFEGQVTTDAKVVTTQAGGSHECDGTNGTGHPPNSPGPTPTTALDDAAHAAGFTWDGAYDSGFGDFFVERIAGDGVVGSFDPNGNFWDLLVDRAPASYGGCQIRIFDGDTVLLEWQTGSKPNLQLTLPAKAQVGQAVDAVVQQYSDSQGTLAPADGASVGGKVTDSTGHASISFTAPGVHTLKATQAGSVRSNAASICVYEPGSTACDSQPSGGVGGAIQDKLPPALAIRGIKNRQKFRRGHGPRKLTGSASDASGLFQVYFRLRRHSHAGCQWYSAKRSVFTRPRPHCTARFQAVGNKSPWSYLLPKRLPKGKYTLEEKAVDSSFNRAISRVNFTVLG